MSLIYLLALIAVSAALLAGFAEAVWSLSRKPAWDSSARALTLVRTVDRRAQQLPFVGAERRRAAVNPRSEVEKLAA
ncbi:MAG TPA: hypothetical protein VFK10_02465 [Burkholderiaceae bacterium]|nr:hypothetical protein [Burkholderiaceae bacterium]